MECTNFIGIDVSQSTFNAALLSLTGKEIQSEAVFANDRKGFLRFYRWLSKEVGRSALSQVVICLEHTGLYDHELSQFLHKKSLKYSHRNPLEIKRSSGIVRGKSDQIDARRIAYFIRKERDQLRLSSPASLSLTRLHRLFAARELRVKHKRALKQHHASIGAIKGDSLIKQLQKNCKTIIDQYEKKIRQLDTQMKQLIKDQGPMWKNYQLLVSVPGIGQINAIYLLITTRNFTAFKTWRQYAAYAGTAPFEHQSGTSLSRPKRVNHFANKKAKTLLTTAAKVAKKHDFELKQFYEKKVKDGKNEFWIINAIRNKIISRAFAVINRQTPYKSVDQFCKWKQEKAAA